MNEVDTKAESESSTADKDAKEEKPNLMTKVCSPALPFSTCSARARFGDPCWITRAASRLGFAQT